MVKPGASPDYRARQREGIVYLSLRPVMDERVTEHAAANSQSVSEVLSEAMEAFIEGSAPPVRERRTRRRTAWVKPERYVAFKKRADALGIPYTEALEHALEDIL